MDLSPKIRQGIIELAIRYELDKVILFGSRARGDNKPRSDIDLAVRGGNIAAFAADVDEELPTLLMFDVVDLDRPVQPELLAEIEKDGIELYSSTPTGIFGYAADGHDGLLLCRSK